MGLLIENCRFYGQSYRSVYIEEGRIACLSEEPTQSVPSGTQRIEGNGGSLLPGLIDTHCHPFEYGWLKRSVDLRGTSNITGLRLRLQARIQKVSQGEWVTGMGWNDEKFPGGKVPNRSDIDDISPRNPVALKRVCGHIALLNTRAIESLGISGKKGPEYERDGSGGLTGIIKEWALTEAFSAIPRSVQACSADLQAVEVEALHSGLTGLHCIVSPEGYAEELEAIHALREAGSLSARYRVYVPPEALQFVEDKGNRKGLDDDCVRINGVKIYADGSLGARTAALREPYSDDSGNVGLLRHSDEELRAQVEKADLAGFQVIVHAIGDRAVEQAINAISAVSGKKNERRHRIEHASLLPRDLRSEMSKRSIPATVQPLFIVSDTWAINRLGEERVLDLYPLKSMLMEGILVSGSSDSPVESLSPVLGVWASMVRAGFAREESLTLDEALRLYTSNASANGLDEAPAGEGSLADFTLLDSMVEGMHPALFRKVGIAATVVGGSPAYSFSD
jgi:predicted amidohydrolase YtcJ